MPLPLAAARVQADQRFGEQVGAEPPAAPVVAARRAGRHVQQAALLVERHQAPDVGVSRIAPGLILPGVRAEGIVRLRNRVEDPLALSATGVERLHDAGRVVEALDAVGDAAADDDEILEHDRRGRLVEGVTHDLPAEPVGQRNPAAVAEVGDELSGVCIEGVQPVAAVQEQPDVVAVAPVRDAAMLEPARAATPRRRNGTSPGRTATAPGPFPRRARRRARTSW